MEELDVAIQQRLFIAAYWPQRQPGEPNIGYAISKKSVFYRVVAAIFSLVTSVFSLFYEAKTRPAIQPVVRFLPVSLVSLTLAILSMREYKYQGYYQLNEEGIPTHFLNRLPPDSIKGRLGVGREKFLKQLTIGG